MSSIENSQSTWVNPIFFASSICVTGFFNVLNEMTWDVTATFSTSFNIIYIYLLISDYLIAMRRNENMRLFSLSFTLFRLFMQSCHFHLTFIRNIHTCFRGIWAKEKYEHDYFDKLFIYVHNLISIQKTILSLRTAGEFNSLHFICIQNRLLRFITYFVSYFD